MQDLYPNNLVTVLTLPTPSVGYQGALVTLDADKRLYYCDGAVWYDVLANLSSKSILLTQFDTSSTALTMVPNLSLPMAANTLYHFEFRIRFQSSATNTGIALSIRTPASVWGQAMCKDIPVGPTNRALQYSRDQNLVQATTAIDVANSSNYANIKGFIQTLDIPTTLNLSVASEVNNNVVRIMPGTSLLMDLLGEF